MNHPLCGRRSRKFATVAECRAYEGAWIDWPEFPPVGCDPHGPEMTAFWDREQWEQELDDQHRETSQTRMLE